MKVIGLFIASFLLVGVCVRYVFAQELVYDPKSHYDIIQQVENTVKLLEMTQKQLDEARTFTKNSLRQVDNLKAIRGQLFHFYNNTFGIIGEAYRTAEKFKEVTDPDQYQQIIKEFEKDLKCLRTDITDMMKLKHVFKTQYQFDEEENKKNKEEKVKNIFFAPGSNNNKFISPYENPSLSDQNLSSCGSVLNFASVRERKIKQYQGWIQMADPNYEKALIKAHGGSLPSGLLPKEILELRYQSILAVSNCPDSNPSNCDGAKLKEVEINANDSEEVKSEKEAKNQYIRQLNERGGKTANSIAEDQLVVLMLMYDTLNSMNKKMTIEFKEYFGNRLREEGEELENDLKNNLLIYGDVNGTTAENARRIDEAARDIGLQDLKSFNLSLQ